MDKKTLISTRNPWYNMEKRENPEFLFAYLGRRNTRFIRNEAGVVPLTGFYVFILNLTIQSMLINYG